MSAARGSGAKQNDKDGVNLKVVLATWVIQGQPSRVFYLEIGWAANPNMGIPLTLEIALYPESTFQRGDS